MGTYCIEVERIAVTKHRVLLLVTKVWERFIFIPKCHSKCMLDLCCLTIFMGSSITDI